eukprot:3222300-Amphidinium_carterae.1
MFINTDASRPHRLLRQQPISMAPKAVFCKWSNHTTLFREVASHLYDCNCSRTSKLENVFPLLFLPVSDSGTSLFDHLEDANPNRQEPQTQVQNAQNKLSTFEIARLCSSTVTLCTRWGEYQAKPSP